MTRYRNRRGTHHELTTSLMDVAFLRCGRTPESRKSAWKLSKELHFHERVGSTDDKKPLVKPFCDTF